MAAAPSSLASSHLSRLADLRRAAAPANLSVPQQLRLGCSRRRAQRVVAMAGSGKFFVGGNWKCVKNSLTERIEVSAQNVWIGKGGAYTGEISAEQLVDIGCQWVILGHSERRHIIGENDEFIGKKAAYALSKNVKAPDFTTIINSVTSKKVVA
nr:unnamed protein product [Digitaria exilis]